MPTNNEEWIDELLTNLDAYKLNHNITTGGIKFSVAEHYAMYPELRTVKQAITQKLQEVERLARVEEINTAIEMTTQVWHNKSLFSNIENINANTLSSTAQYLLTRKAQLTPTSQGDSK